jgi:clorobiocin biosynthesis protein CloN4
MTYRQLDRAAAGASQALLRLGVRKGDRVAIAAQKSCRTLAAMLGALRIGAACVPIHPWTPPARIRVILADCAAAALIADKTTEAAGHGLPTLATQEWSGGAWWADEGATAVSTPADPGGADDLALILYTSGSTGRPKGVCLSHRNVLAFVNWATQLVAARSTDCFANHAPLQFDLSVFDIYGAFAAGARVVLAPEPLSYAPARLVELIRREAITIWYSVPSVLVHMMESGGLLELDAPSLRVVLFAGEVFPIRHLRALRQRWPHVRLINFFGPTETNVCTWYEVEQIGGEQTRPVPIGAAASGDRVWAVADDGRPAEPGEVGELLVSGPSVMLGYWGQPPLGGTPHQTGDLVRVREDGSFDFLGRRDHMVKIRGCRVELGEVEAALVEHPAIREAAVLVNGSGPDARLVAFVLAAPGTQPSLLEVKRHCAERLPRYMSVDHLKVVADLPRTPNGKIDRLLLAQTEQRAGAPAS